LSIGSENQHFLEKRINMGGKIKRNRNKMYQPEELKNPETNKFVTPNQGKSTFQVHRGKFQNRQGGDFKKPKTEKGVTPFTPPQTVVGHFKQGGEPLSDPNARGSKPVEKKEKKNYSSTAVFPPRGEKPLQWKKEGGAQ